MVVTCAPKRVTLLPDVLVANEYSALVDPKLPVNTMSVAAVNVKVRAVLSLSTLPIVNPPVELVKTTF